MINVLLVFGGQSNQQGAAKLEGGVVTVRHTSEYLNQTDPFPGCNNVNQGGSMFPYLIDFGRIRGVNYTILNYCIGGASVSSYLGISGATVSGGGAATPADVGYMGSIGLTGGSGIPDPGAIDRDPFGLLARWKAAIAAKLATDSYDAVITAWANGESDAGNSAAFYQARLEAIAEDVMLPGNVGAHFIGLSSKPASQSNTNYDTLRTGVANAITARVSDGKPVFVGGDVDAHYRERGTTAPLHPENDTTTRVHLTLRGQEVQAWLWDRAFAAAGY